MQRIPDDAARMRFIKYREQVGNMEIKRAVVPFEQKDVNLKGEFEGYASTFGNIDLGGDVIMPGAFDETLKEWSDQKQLPLMPWFHDMKMPVGDWLEMRVDDRGLFVRGKLWIDEGRKTNEAVMVHNLLTGTGPKAMSIGYSAQESDIVEKDGEVVRQLKSVKLWENSIVPFGMNPKALVTDAKSLVHDDGNLLSIRDFEKGLRDAGFSRSQAKIILSQGYKALLRDADDATGDDSEREAAKLLGEMIENAQAHSILF